MKRMFAIISSFAILIGMLSGVIYAVDGIAKAKIDTNLTAAIEESSTSTSLAYVSMADISDDEAMDRFKQLYPYEYNVYMYSKYDQVGDMTEEEIAAIDDDAVQNAIERKREVYKQLYSEYNSGIIERYYDESDVLFISSYAPVAIVETDTTSLTWSARNSSVLSITSFTDYEMQNATDIDAEASITSYIWDNIMDGIDLANQISRADVVRDEKGMTGDGVKIGIVEAEGVPDSGNVYLGSTMLHMRAGDYINSNHATAVACILVGEGADGTVHGVAPDAELYCCIGSTLSEFYEAVEWLLDSGVNIINASLGYKYYYGYYDNMSAWVDHIAIQHDVHFVTSAGNENTTAGHYITAPGMAYNAITVGNFDANGSVDVADFTMAASSSYMELSEDVDYYAEKPNLVANGVFADAGYNSEGNICDIGGTSFTAPQVAGVIAQLCDYSSSLKTKQTRVGAILTASSAKKVEAVGSGEKGDSFLTSVYIGGSNQQVSDKEGVGILDARWAWGVVVNQNYWSVGIYSGEFPYSMTVTINASVNTLTRVAIFWLKHNTVTDHSSGSVTSTDPQIPNLNLCVYGPDGSLLGSSYMYFANFEVVQFVPPSTGEYTIVITSPDDQSANVGIAVW